MESEKLKEIYKELKSFCKENNIETGKSGYLMGLFTKYHRALSQHDVSKRKFAVEWMRNVNYGIGSGTEYFDAETREEALKLFWDGKNKEAFEVNTIYVC